MEPVEQPQPYVLRGEDAIQEVLELEAELLRREGIDPRWPGFDADPPERQEDN